MYVSAVKTCRTLSYQWTSQCVRFDILLDTHNRSLQRQVFRGNQLHWYWQPKIRQLNTTYTINTKEIWRKLHALANRTIYTLSWNAFYGRQSANRARAILRAPHPTRDYYTSVLRQLLL